MLVVCAEYDSSSYEEQNQVRGGRKRAPEESDTDGEKLTNMKRDANKYGSVIWVTHGWVG